MPYIETEVDVDVDSFFEECSEYEKVELKDLVLRYFDLEPEEVSVFEPVIKLIDGPAASEFVRRIVSELEYKLKMRDFTGTLEK